MPKKGDKRKKPVKGSAAKAKTAKAVARAVAGAETSSTSVLVDNKSAIIRSLLSKSI